MKRERLLFILAAGIAVLVIGWIARMTFDEVRDANDALAQIERRQLDAENKWRLLHTKVEGHTATLDLLFKAATSDVGARRNELTFTQLLDLSRAIHYLDLKDDQFHAEVIARLEALKQTH